MNLDRFFFGTLGITLALCLEFHFLVAGKNDLPGLYHNEGSENFIIRWGFQAVCDHVYDPQTVFNPTTRSGVTIDPKAVKRGDIVFVRSIDTFMEKIHPYIDYPYLIVTHGEKEETNQEHQRRYLDDPKIVAWFSIHPLKEGHKKYFPLPLGIYQAEKNYAKRKKINNLLKKLRDKTPKTRLLYVNLEKRTSDERAQIVELFENKFPGVTVQKRVPWETYMSEMAHHKFTLSPRGAGPDCYRTWEALLVGTIPIVSRCAHGRDRTWEILEGKLTPLGLENARAEIEKIYVPCEHSQLDDLYAGLPVLIVDSWDQVTEEFLNEKYKEICSKKYNIRPLYLEYWRDKIKKVQREFLNSKTS